MFMADTHFKTELLIFYNFLCSDLKMKIVIDELSIHLSSP